MYASQLANDFTPSAAFLVRVRQKGLVSFTYAGRAHGHPKEGVAVAYRRPDAPGQYVALVTAYDEEGYNQQRSLFRSFLYGNLGVLALLGLLGSLFADRALAPVTFLIRQLRSASASTLRFQLRAVNDRDEVGLLASAFNELLARQEALVENQRAFISQASHELRTPLTTIKGWLQTSLAYDADVAGLQKGIRQAVGDLDKLTTLANGLLQLAQLDGTQARIDGHPLELMDVLLDIIDTAQQHRPAQSLTLTVADAVAQQPEAPRVLGHAHLLRTAVDNLIDNAAKYSAGRPARDPAAEPRPRSGRGAAVRGGRRTGHRPRGNDAHFPAPHARHAGGPSTRLWHWPDTGPAHHRAARGAAAAIAARRGRYGGRSMAAVKPSGGSLRAHLASRLHRAETTYDAAKSCVCKSFSNLRGRPPAAPGAHPLQGLIEFK